MGSCEQSNRPSSFIKWMEFIDYLRRGRKKAVLFNIFAKIIEQEW
jgi:hypothetical protein